MVMKKILYLHGLESSNVCDKVDFLKEVSDCYAPYINYKDSDIEKQLIKMVVNFNPDLIIGSSMGGYAALLLGNFFKVDVIAFNPAIHSRSFKPNLERLETIILEDRFKPIIILGMEDDVVNPLISKEILEDALFYCTIEEINGLGHRIPFDIFSNIYNKYVK
jgi:hypothetical protein